MKPGDSLHYWLDRFGYSITDQCECREHIERMNVEGKAWCKRNVPLILGWLRAEAEKRGEVFPERSARSLVRFAIWVSVD